jgi:hypothetical protein
VAFVSLYVYETKFTTMNSNFTTKIILSTVMLLATLTNLHAQAPYDRDYNNQQYANQNQSGNGQDFYYYPEQDVYYNANYNNYSYNNGRSWITVNILPPTICIDRSPRIIVYGRGRQIWQNNRSHRDYYFRQGHNRQPQPIIAYRDNNRWGGNNREANNRSQEYHHRR